MKMSRFSKIIFVLGVCLITTSCAIFSETEQDIMCVGEAHYQVTFESTWSPETHPVEHPKTQAHYSKLVGATHNSEKIFWKSGLESSNAIKDIAEKGKNYQFKKSVMWSIKIDEAGSYIDGPALETGTGKLVLEFAAVPDFPQVSLISMIAPSPDWIVGVSGLELCANGEWHNDISHPLIALDAGTAEGTNYAYAGEGDSTTPREVIKPVVNERLGISPRTNFGTLNFKKLN